MKILDFLKQHLYTICVNLLVILFGFAYFHTIKQAYDDTKNPPALKEVAGIQNHLVWSVNGECYFVRPHNDYTNYLIRTKDCDKR